jgi:DNA polymerase IV (DinB-like DNA polymerase)
VITGAIGFMRARIIMLVDFDYFFAQCEELRNPSLKDKPVVVCVYSGRSEDSGAVSTANYVARKYGVKSGIPISLAKKKLENVEAVFLPVDYSFYEKISDEIVNILRGYADHFEQVGVDEAFLDVSQKVNESFDKAKTLGTEIKEEIKAQKKLTCSIGIGPNKLVAKIAADYQKPDGLTVIVPDEVNSFLSSLPIEKLIGVGVKTKEKMQALGINTIGDLAKRDVQKLIEVFGKSQGTYFRYTSMGIDNDPVQEKGEAESISRIATLKEDTTELDIIVDKTNQLCDEVYGDLSQRRLSFKTISIIAIMTNLSTHSRSMTFETPKNDLSFLKEKAKELFGKFIEESGLKMRRVGVKVSGLTKEQKSQKQLTSFFETGDE